MAQTTTGGAIPTAELSIRDQIKAERAKERADVKDGPLARAWDRDSNGKRPWDVKDAPAK